MDRGKRQGDRLRKVGAIWNQCGTTDTTNELATANTNELAATNSIHQYNTIHQYIYYYQQTATKIPSNNESTAANNYTQSAGGNANAGG